MVDAEVVRAFRVLVDGFAGPAALPAGGAAGVVAIATGLAVGAKALAAGARGRAEEGLRAALDSARERVASELERDCDAFDAVLAARRRPRGEPGRDDALRAAWRDATRASATVAELASAAADLLARAAGHVAPAVAADLHAARLLVRAGLEIAVTNARDNAGRLDPELARELLSRLPTL